MFYKSRLSVTKYQSKGVCEVFKSLRVVTGVHRHVMATLPQKHL